MATLITPDREQMTPVSAPSMMGIELAKVPCSRFTTLTPVVSPASAQQNSETMNKNMTSAMATRRHNVLNGRKARSTATAHVAGEGGGQRQVRHGHLGERLGEREGRVTLVGVQPEHEDVDEPEEQECRGCQPAPERADRGAGGQHLRDTLGDRHAFHPLDRTSPMPAAPAARSRYMARISGGAAMNKTTTACSTSTMSTGVPV